MTKWLFVCVALFFMAPSAFAQATSRPCDPSMDQDKPSPACLLGHIDIGTLPAGDLYWHIQAFDAETPARAAMAPGKAYAQAFGKYWVFWVGPNVPNETATARIGPLPVPTRNGDFALEILQSTFSPGMTAPVHVHSGPEAFYAVTGDTCLETTDGVQVAKGAGSSLIIREGPAMLLMATGKDMRRGFAIILHDKARAPTTLTHDWHPAGLCHP